MQEDVGKNILAHAGGTRGYEGLIAGQKQVRKEEYIKSLQQENNHSRNVPKRYS